MDGGATSAPETDVDTNVTTRTDKTSYEVPEDGSPITISTAKVTSTKGFSTHDRQKSQTSLLIEYFEASKVGTDKGKSKPSVRVKVTPSSKKKRRSGEHDAIQITGIGRDRKPSYTRRITLGGSGSRNADAGRVPTTEGTELSHSSGSANPVEIEVLNSDVSSNSRGLRHAANESNVSSMPPDSMLDGEIPRHRDRNKSRDHGDDMTAKDDDLLDAPAGTRNRSASRERIAQRVMEKLGQSAARSHESSKFKSTRGLEKDYDRDGHARERRHRSSKSHHYEEETVSGADSRSNLSESQRSYRSSSDVSKISRFTDNPRLLEMVEDTIKRVIMPELNAAKEDHKRDRSHRSHEDGRDLERRVSKSSSTPNISRKPKVVLNREGDDPGTVLSRGDSERKTRKSSREHRPSSRRSSGKHSSIDEEETVRAASSKTSRELRNTTPTGSLTAGALKMHDSQSDERRHRGKRSSKSRDSRSRSASLVEIAEAAYTRKEDIPPMPMASHINDSDVTRESLLSRSAVTETRLQASHTPVREVSRGAVASPTSARTHTPLREGSRATLDSAASGRASDRSRTALSRELDTGPNDHSVQSPRNSADRSDKSRKTALAAAGLGGAVAAGVAKHAYDRRVDADGYGSAINAHKMASPVQSVSSLKKNFEGESVTPTGSRPHSAASSRVRDQASVHSAASSPTGRLTRSEKLTDNVGGDAFVTPMERPVGGVREATPVNGESVEDWYARQHELNERYRDSMDDDSAKRDTNRDSYQTNPYPQDEKRFAQYNTSNDRLESPSGERELKPVGLSPYLVHHSHGAESNVASLMNPSTASSNMRSSMGSGASLTKGSFAARLRELGKDGPSPMYEGSTLSQTIPSQDRWAALSGRAREMSASSRENVHERDPASPAHSEARSLAEKPVMSASGLPRPSDPLLPEIGHFDDTKSDLDTNPSVVQGPLGGDATGHEAWPYTPEPESRGVGANSGQSLRSGDGRGKTGLAIATGAGAAALAAGGAFAAAHQAETPGGFDGDGHVSARNAGWRRHVDGPVTPSSPAGFRDEGYVTENPRSTGGLTPRKEQQQQYNKNELESQDLGGEGPFVGSQKRVRHTSGDSHGMDSPLYDRATGKGIDNIESKDIVALMDHLTVRDAQRNARDTEILVTLVRSAAETRQNLDDMKRFIVEQDKLIMQNSDRCHDQTQRVLSGPRPMTSSPRTPRQQSEEEMQTKRRGVLRRAIKGLTGGKSTNDLARVEDMLAQILDNVEDLKAQQGPAAPHTGPSRARDSMDTYERLRNMADSGYEPEGQAGTSSTPSHSGQLSTTPRVEKHQFHSGYDGRRGSEHRVSTVLEGDEDDLEPHESRVLDHQFEDNGRMLTPTQETHRQQPRFSSPVDAAYAGAGAAHDVTPRSADKRSKHKSNSSSMFGGFPKISRWSKTTSSSGAPDPNTIDSPSAARGQRPDSEASRSGSMFHQYDHEQYNVSGDDRLRSTQSLAREQHAMDTRSVHSQGSRLMRTPSPLIPSDASFRPPHDHYVHERGLSPDQDGYDPEFDDPKYQAHRNSILLMHPQPRQGTTGRHQNALESHAHEYPHDPTATTNSDLSQRTVSDDVAMWGSSGTAALSKHRMTHAGPMSSEGMGGARGHDDGPLVPQPLAMPPKVRHDDVDQAEWEPTYSNSGFGLNDYSSPYGSGHLLEPIAEVRKSLETDRGHVRWTDGEEHGTHTDILSSSPRTPRCSHWWRGL